MANTDNNKTTTVTGGSFGDNKVHFSETERTDGKGTDLVVQSTTSDGKEHITVHPDGTINHHGTDGKTTTYPNSGFLLELTLDICRKSWMVCLHHSAILYT